MRIAKAALDEANLLLTLTAPPQKPKKTKKVVQFVSVVEVKLIQNLATQTINEMRAEFVEKVRTKRGLEIGNIKHYLKFRLIPEYENRTDESVESAEYSAYNIEDIQEDPEGYEYVELTGEQDELRGTARLIEHARRRGFL